MSSLASLEQTRVCPQAAFEWILHNRCSALRDGPTIHRQTIPSEMFAAIILAEIAGEPHVDVLYTPSDYSAIRSVGSNCFGGSFDCKLIKTDPLKIRIFLKPAPDHVDHYTYRVRQALTETLSKKASKKQYKKEHVLKTQFYGERMELLHLVKTDVDKIFKLRMDSSPILVEVKRGDLHKALAHISKVEKDEAAESAARDLRNGIGQIYEDAAGPVVPSDSSTGVLE